MELLSSFLGARRIGGERLESVYRMTKGGINVFVVNYQRCFDGSEFVDVFVDISNGEKVFSVSRKKGSEVSYTDSVAVRDLFESGNGFSLAKGGVMSRRVRGLLEEGLEKYRRDLGL